jgi:hypothetical protein
MMSRTPPNTEPCTDAFTYLQAEREEAWLDQVFVPPAAYELVTAPRSVLLLGDSGAGKSTVHLFLARQAHADPGISRPLNATWRLRLLDPKLEGSQLVHACLDQIFDACAQALLRYVGQQPAVYAELPGWVRDTVHWYLRRYLGTAWDRNVDRLGEQCDATGIALLRSLGAAPVPDVLHADAPPELVIAELAEAVHNLQFAGLWVWLDGLEPWVQADPAHVARTLRALFAALALFEVPGFAVKVTAPVELAAAIADASGIERHRIDLVRLCWSAAQLEAVVERRLALLLGRAEFGLADLGDAATVKKWLERYGGDTPRGWLHLVRPLAAEYRQKGAQHAFSGAECDVILSRQLPLLRLDQSDGRVFLGSREIGEVQPAGLKILRYLYTQRPRMCTRSEIYYRACLGLDHEPHAPQDQFWEAPAAWADNLDTALWRLRQAIEFDPKHPVYLISKRGKGVQLIHTW